EALTATRLFESPNPAKVINFICNKPIDPPSKINPDVPLELDRICLRALARDPDARYRSADEMAGELDELLFKMRWGAAELARMLESTISLGTLVEPGALEPSTGGERPAPPPETLPAKARATPSSKRPSSRETTAPVLQANDADKTTPTVSPPLVRGTNTTEKNAVFPEAYSGTEEAPLPEAATVALPPRAATHPPFDHHTRVVPSKPPPGWTDASTTIYRRLSAWRWPLAAAAGLLAVTLIVVLGRAAMLHPSAAPAVTAADSVELTVTSEPSGAQAIVEGPTRVIGITPLTTRLSRGDGYALRVSQRGYEPYSMPLTVDKDLRTHVVLRALR
ncbi:MAG TPA: PEGA domain-containing protein, partial [Polyangia bacterium]|nr:PEGA domain-containing protein [Polyangia bacterium]